MGSAVDIYFFSWRYFFALVILSAGVIFPLVSEKRCSVHGINERLSSRVVESLCSPNRSRVLANCPRAFLKRPCSTACR